MMQGEKNPSLSGKNLLILLFSSLALTSFLFYIDEGTYTFEWVKNKGSWVVFCIYLIPIFLGQVIVHEMLLRKYRIGGKLILSFLLGSALGILTVVGMFTFKSIYL
jgi:hypothetical protein